MEKSYSATTKREGSNMIYSLQNFRHHLLEKNFNWYIDHQTLKYIKKKTILAGRIIKCLMLFQEYEFKFFVKLRKSHVVSDHLQRIENGEENKQGRIGFS